jgi:hypothetical protein
MHPTLLFCLHQTILLVNERESLPYWWLNHFWTNPSFIFLLYTFQVGNDYQQTQCHECYVTCKYNLLTNRAWPILGHRSLPISVTANQNHSFLYIRWEWSISCPRGRQIQFHSSNSPKVHAQTVCSDLSNEVDLIAKAHIANGWISSTLKAKPNCFLRSFYEAIRYILCLSSHYVYIYIYIQSFIFIDTNNKYTL